MLGVFTWLDRPTTPDPTPPTPVPPTGSPASTNAPGAAPEAAPEGWVRVLDLADLPPGVVVEVLLADRPVALVNVDGTPFAVDGTCPHAGGPLGDGVVEGAVLTCPWHGWSWDVTTGRSLVDESQTVETLAVKVISGGIWLPAV